MKILLCLFAALFMWINAAALEFGLITGQVRDARLHQQLPEANVMVLGANRGDVTNFAGEFNIPRVQAGQHTLRISFIGYKTQEIHVEVAAGQTTKVDLSLAPNEAIPLGEIFVYANRATLYPQSNLLVADVERQWPKDVGEFLRAAPAVSAIRKGGTAMDPVVRGFRQDQLNVQVDGGMKVCGACPNRMDPPTAHIQAEDLEKIEVLKGPFSVRFGPTLGAVINLVMEKPAQFDQAGLTARLESGYESNWDGTRMRATVAAGAPKFDGYFSGGSKNFGSYRAGDGTDVNSSFNMRDYSLKLGYNPGPQSRLQFTNRGSYMRDVYYPALPMDALYDDTHIYALDYARESIGAFVSSITAKGYASFVSHSMANQWKPTYSMVHAQTDVESQVLGGRVEAVLAPKPNVFLYVGLDGNEMSKTGDRTRAFVSGPNAGKTLLDTVWQDSRIRTMGLFLESRVFLSEPLTLIAGARLDFVDIAADRPNKYYRANFADWLSVTEKNPGGLATLLYTLSPAVDLRFGIGHGARTADMTERFVYIQPIGMDRYDYIGNPTLKPEQNTQLDFTTNVHLGQVNLSTSVFYSLLKNLITAQVDNSVKKISMDALGVKRFVNADRAEITGIEASAGLPILNPLRCDVSVAFIRGQDKTTNAPLPEIPPLSSTAVLRYQPLESSTWIELEGRFAARQSRISTAFQEAETPGFSMYSLRAGVRLFSYVRLTAAVTNIFDAAYYEHLNRRNKVDGRPILEPGRAVALNLQIVY